MKKVFYTITMFLILTTNSLGDDATAQAQMFPANATNGTIAKIKVKKVLSADTFLLETDQKVRLIGLKAPAAPRQEPVAHDENGFIVEKTSLTTTLEERAFGFAVNLLQGQYVRLEFDTEKKDSSSFLLAYVFLLDNNTFVNAEILRQGYATLSLTPPNLKYQDTLRSSYRQAREERRGVHEDN